MEKKLVYLKNLLFLLFDKYISEPEVIGEKVANAIIGAIRQLIPTRNGLSSEQIVEVQRSWFRRFTDGMNKIFIKCDS